MNSSAQTTSDSVAPLKSKLLTLAFLEDEVHLCYRVLPMRLFFLENGIGQLVLAVINSSLFSSEVPANFKHVLVQRLIKKHGLDQTLDMETDTLT